MSKENISNRLKDLYKKIAIGINLSEVDNDNLLLWARKTAISIKNDADKLGVILPPLPFVEDVSKDYVLGNKN